LILEQTFFMQDATSEERAEEIDRVTLRFDKPVIADQQLLTGRSAVKMRLISSAIP
jgi:hypothetical protein